MISCSSPITTGGQILLPSQAQSCGALAVEDQYLRSSHTAPTQTHMLQVSGKEKEVNTKFLKI